MKNFHMLTVAMMVAMMLAGCSKGGDEQITEGTTRLSVMLDDGTPVSRAIEGMAGSNDATKVEDGFVYVIDASGNAVSYELNVTDAKTSVGQYIGEVKMTSTVYVVANIPEGQGDYFESLSTLDEIKSAESMISTQSNYKTAALVNRSAVAVAISDPDGDGQAVVNVNLTPLIARLELTRVRGGLVTDTKSPNWDSWITSFDVAGVYLDNFFTSFRWDGTGVDLYQMGPSPDYSEIIGFGMGDETVVSSSVCEVPTSSTSSMATAPPLETFGAVWAYNVAAGGLPMLVVKLTNVVINNDPYYQVTLAGQSTPVRAIDQTFYITVKNYAGMTTPTFERGNVYRVDAIEFTADHLKYTRPNADNIDLSVKVQVDPWVPHNIHPEI